MFHFPNLVVQIGNELMRNKSADIKIGEKAFDQNSLNFGFLF
jgi:hypothetical protein